ncbi:Phytochrome-like protein cph1 [Lachnellula cervina]|uniref:Phytochrome-like protein cph1 n=1 Tax=Lachnellula cervina TaxID=1316786 RepID=A0A7D8UY53_9HELO|nr:Phytochrome-like protein cph1 [Lachnellula cervina]
MASQAPITEHLDPEAPAPAPAPTARSGSLLASGEGAAPKVSEFKIERTFPIRIHAPKKASTSTAATFANNSLDEEPRSRVPPSHTTATTLAVHSSSPVYTHSSSPQVTIAQNATTTSAALGSRYITNRSSFLSTTDNNVSTAPSTPEQKVYRCEDEPIHIPGAIQSFGALIAVNENEDGLFVVRIVSENSKAVTGLDPESLFSLRCLTDLFPQSDKLDFISRAKALRTYKTRTSPDVFTLSLSSLVGSPIPLFCAMHLNDESDLIIFEFELENDVFNSGDALPKEPVQVADNHPTDNDVQQSTTSRSAPLYSLGVARERNRNLGSLEIFQILSEIQHQLGTAEVLSDLLDIIVGLVRELTGFHRIMCYQFDETASGSVVSELLDLRASGDLYRGLHFPASDIPKQARDLYLVNTIRVLYDRDQETSRLLCRTAEDAKAPLNLKHSYLRAFSPVHLKYLENMGVRASMSISLIVQGKLWGLISCHGYGSGMRVSLPVRELCRGLGDIASSNVEKLLYSSRIKARKPLAHTLPQTSPSAYIAASTSDLLQMFDADFAFLVIKGEARTVGKLLAYRECVNLLQYVRQRSFTSVFHSQNIAVDCKDAMHSPGALATLSGMLVVPLALSGADFLVFFRRGKQKEIHWAGNPHEKSLRPGTAYLEPRSSFKRWSQSVTGTSREWTEDQVESAVVLSTLYGRFIEVWRQKEAIVQKNKMTRLLIRNAGHEVRTPLNSIINYLEVALEETLDESARLHLQKSLQASKSLIYVVNDLLRLTEAENADFQTHEDNLDLRKMCHEIIGAFGAESARKKVEVRFQDDQEVPPTVRCDPSGLRQVLSNLMANAIKHSSTEGDLIQISVKFLGTTDTKTMIEISFQDQGSGLSEQDLDRIFQDFEQILDEDDSQILEVPKIIPKPQSSLVSIGLGLATTARFVRLNHGQISIASEEGHGTRVSINIPFRKALRFHRDKRPATEISLPTPPDLGSTNQEAGPTTPASATPSEASPSKALRDGQYSSSSKRRKESPLGLPKLTDAEESPHPQLDVSALSPVSPKTSTDHYPFPRIGSQLAKNKFRVLVAEDNPLNSRLIETRLARSGHEVTVTVDGQACADAFTGTPGNFDVILMDIQMPIVDGISCTRKIREFEKVHSPEISEYAKPYGRVPVIAVSASLSEEARGNYVESGFDGWILKPIDFKRLEAILAAILDELMREHLQYGNASWRNGGWFTMSGGGSGPGIASDE